MLPIISVEFSVVAGPVGTSSELAIAIEDGVPTPMHSRSDGWYIRKTLHAVQVLGYGGYHTMTFGLSRQTRRIMVDQHHYLTNFSRQGQSVNQGMGPGRYLAWWV
jgi:hypothetical protein